MTPAPTRLLAALLLACMPFASATKAQPFDIPSPNVPSDVRGVNPSLTVSFGSQKWADFNADGEMDFVMVGRLPATDLGVIPLFGDVFRSSPSRPEPTSPLIYNFFSSRTLRSMWLTDVDWGDYDNDGDLDLIVMGATSVDGTLEPETVLYRTSGNQLSAVDDIQLPGLHSGGVDWGDFDRDGDLDLALSGVGTDGGHLTTIFRNDRGNVFVDMSPGLAQVAYGDVEWVDYDVDGDLDLMLIGSEREGSQRLILYVNGGDGSLVDSGQNLSGVEHASASWGDYDSDGDPDLVVTGYERSPLLGNGVTRLYRNDEGLLSEVEVSLPGVYYGDVHWVDYDRDGDLDVSVSGRREPFGSNTTVACLQSGTSGSFACTPIQVAGLGGQPVPGLAYGSIGWADYDHDTDLDLFVTGVAGRDGAVTAFYRNAGVARNIAPSAPTGLQTSVSGSSVDLTWLGATDPDGPSASLGYSVRVGTIPGGVDVMAPHADPITGIRHVLDGGNVGQALGFTLSNLPPATYYWSVQSIDVSFAGSPFAAEQTFTIGGL